MEIEVEAKKDTKKGMDEYEVKCAADTLMKAKEIEADADMMEAVKPLLEKQASTIKQITGGKKIDSLDKLKAKKKEVMNKPDEEDEY